MKKHLLNNLITKIGQISTILVYLIIINFLLSCNSNDYVLTPFKEDAKLGFLQTAKWGYKNKKGEIVISPQFVYGHEFEQGLALVNVDSSFLTTTFKNIKREGRWGLIDKKGKFVIAPQFDVAIYSNERVIMVKVGDKWGFIDYEGKTVAKPQFDEVTRFEEGLAGVKVGNRWGFINKEGEIMINPLFDDINDFDEGGLAAVKVGDKWGFIDKEGKIIINPQFDVVGNFRNEGLASIMIDYKWGFIDKRGKIVIYPQFDDADWFSNGLAKIKVGNKFGFINKKGKMIINPQFDDADRFNDDGLACVNIGGTLTAGKYGIDIYGYERDVSGGKWGFIDKTGNFLINPKFDEPFEFNERGKGSGAIDGKYINVNRPWVW